MADVHCRVCGEPWDAFDGFADLGEAAVDLIKEGRLEIPPGTNSVRLFLQGRGCPSCCYRGLQGDTVEDVEADVAFLREVDDATDGDEIWDAIEGL